MALPPSAAIGSVATSALSEKAVEDPGDKNKPVNHLAAKIGPLVRTRKDRSTSIRIRRMTVVGLTTRSITDSSDCPNAV